MNGIVVQGRRGLISPLLLLPPLCVRGSCTSGSPGPTSKGAATTRDVRRRREDDRRRGRETRRERYRTWVTIRIRIRERIKDEKKR